MIHITKWQRPTRKTPAPAELFVYPGSTHLFTDASLPDFQPDSAELVMQRTLRFLETAAP